MARFILDIDSASVPDTKEFMELFCERAKKHIVTITCIDNSNNNQFEEHCFLNYLSKEQIDNYNKAIQD